MPGTVSKLLSVVVFESLWVLHSAILSRTLYYGVINVEQRPRAACIYRFLLLRGHTCRKGTASRENCIPVTKFIEIDETTCSTR
jgi:hypothetical protein